MVSGFSLVSGEIIVYDYGDSLSALFSHIFNITIVINYNKNPRATTILKSAWRQRRERETFYTWKFTVKIYLLIPENKCEKASKAKYHKSFHETTHIYSNYFIEHNDYIFILKNTRCMWIFCIKSRNKYIYLSIISVFYVITKYLVSAWNILAENKLMQTQSQWREIDTVSHTFLGNKLYTNAHTANKPSAHSK